MRVQARSESLSCIPRAETGSSSSARFEVHVASGEL